MLAGRSYAGRGRFVFHSSNGSRRFVLVQADATAGLALDQGFGEFVLDVTLQGSLERAGSVAAVGAGFFY